MIPEPMDTPAGRALYEAVRHARRVFQEHGLKPPTTMIVGEDVKEQLRASGVVPDEDGIWVNVMGVDIR